jgi:hypothetical protein
MAFDAAQALSAIAYGGNGYYQGFNSAQDNNYRHAMQQMQAQDASYDLQAKRRQQQYAQQLSDSAMHYFQPQVPPIPGSQPQGDANGQPPQGNQANPADMATKFDSMANDALARGDVVGGGQALSMATNLRSEQLAQQQKQSAIQSSTLKSDIQDLQYVAQVFNGTQNDPAAFEAAKMQVLSNPDISLRERQNIAQLQYSPGMVDQIVQHGMTVAQSKQDQLRQLEQQQRAAHERFIEQNDTAKLNLEKARFAAQQQKAATGGKVGAVKVPTANDLNNATQATKDVMGPNVDTDSEDFKNAQQSIAARGLQLMSQNRGMNADQAFAQAAQEAKASGELSTVSIPQKYQGILGKLPSWMGNTPASTKTTFKEKGDTKQSAIPLSKGLEPVDGKFYTHNGKIYQGQGGKLIQVQ